MPSVVYKKSVEGFGITFIEAASYGIGSIGGKDGIYTLKSLIL